MSNQLSSENVIIRDVWNENLEDEFVRIRLTVDDYPYIAFDSEFPGKVRKPAGDLRKPEVAYRALKDNVDILKVIQVGLTLSDGEGKLPVCGGTGKFIVWQFNFREFNPNEDEFDAESLDLLLKSGIDFIKNQESGVYSHQFSELLTSSGAVLTPNVQWLTFHGLYDLGFLVKLLTGKNLPDTLAEFLETVKRLFPILYDIRHVIRYIDGLHGGLDKIATMLNVNRLGTSHQAGSDSLLTSSIYFELKKSRFDGSPKNYAGVLFGLEEI